jgi:hypothetical protein
VARDSVAPESAITDQAPAYLTTIEVRRLVKKAQEGDAQALAILERYWPAHEYWSSVGGDVAEEAEAAFIRASAPDAFKRLAVRMTLQRTRNELAGPNPTPLVRLAARNAALCNLEANLAHNSSANSIAKGLVPSHGNQLWLDRADARFRKALKTLADMQRLAIPMLQVNVGGQQVNIATGQVHVSGLAGPAAPMIAPGPPAPADGGVRSAGRQDRARTRSRRAPVGADPAAFDDDRP